MLRRARLLEDPRGRRSRLESLGVSLQLYFDHYVGALLRGGARSGNALRNSGSWDLLARADLGELARLHGLSLFLHTKGNYGRNVNPRVGALSDPIDDADFDEPIWVDQLWLEQGWWEGRLRLRAGYLDLQTSFDRNAYANSEDRQFMSAFLDNDGVVPLRVGFGATLVARPATWLELALGTADADAGTRVAGFDTAFDGFESLTGFAEATFRTELASAWGPLPGSYRVGVFFDGARRRVFGGGPSSGSTARGHPGGYLSFDQLLFREHEASEEGLGVFARFARIEEEVSRIERFWSAGLRYRGLLPARGADTLGAAAYRAIASDRYRRAEDSDFDGETGVEVYYRIQALPWLELTPDLQWIVDPGGSQRARDALVVVFRIRVTL